MVAVEVADEDFHFAVEADFVYHHLVLCVFAAVKHPLVGGLLYYDAGEAALWGGYAAACS